MDSGQGARGIQMLDIMTTGWKVRPEVPYDSNVIYPLGIRLQRSISPATYNGDLCLLEYVHVRSDIVKIAIRGLQFALA